MHCCEAMIEFLISIERNGYTLHYEGNDILILHNQNTGNFIHLPSIDPCPWCNKEKA